MIQKVLLEIVRAADKVLVGIEINAVGILLERIGGQLPAHEHCQQQYEGQGDRQTEKVDEGVEAVLADEVEERFHDNTVTLLTALDLAKTVP